MRDGRQRVNRLGTVDREGCVQVLLRNRFARTVVGAYTCGVSCEDISYGLRVNPSRVRSWTVNGAAVRGVLEIVIERAVEGLNPDEAWAQMLALDWWEFDPVPSRASTLESKFERVMGPRVEVPRAVTSGLLTPQEAEKLDADVSLRRVSAPVREFRPVPPADMPPPEVVRAAGNLMFWRAQRALSMAKTLGAMTNEQIGSTVAMPVTQVELMLKKIAKRGIDASGEEPYALATVTAWQTKQGSPVR